MFRRGEAKIVGYVEENVRALEQLFWIKIEDACIVELSQKWTIVKVGVKDACFGTNYADQSITII